MSEGKRYEDNTKLHLGLVVLTDKYLAICRRKEFVKPNSLQLTK